MKAARLVVSALLLPCATLQKGIKENKSPVQHRALVLSSLFLAFVHTNEKTVQLVSYTVFVLVAISGIEPVTS